MVPLNQRTPKLFFPSQRTDSILLLRSNLNTPKMNGDTACGSDGNSRIEVHDGREGHLRRDGDGDPKLITGGRERSAVIGIGHKRSIA